MNRGAEWPQEDRWPELDKRGRCRHDGIAYGENVEAGAKRRCFFVEQVHISGMVPSAGVEPVDERLEGGQRFCRGEGAVASAMYENLAQLVGVASGVHHALIRLLILVDHQTIAGRVHGQHWD